MPQRTRTAIIDIGSNSVRLVAYAGPARAPAIIFNEKIAAGLGRSLAATGRIDAEAERRALAGLRRFAALTAAMGVATPTVVATAAIREATNGADVVAAIRALGLPCDVLSGEDEARAAGYGVISAFPDADGIVADLGGGSLELVRIADGRTHRCTSLPLGVLRLPPLREGLAGPRGAARLRAAVAARLVDAGWPGDSAGLPLYLVGGSWRALSRLDMHLTDYALPIMDQHDLPLAAIPALADAVERMDLAALKAEVGLPGARAAVLGDAVALLDALTATLASSHMIVSSSGLREGLLYQRLDARQRAEDPLLVAAEEEGRRLARFAGHGRLLDRWLSPLFRDDPPDMARLRLAACLLSDVAWAANPDFRADRGLEIALHGNWRGIDIPGRIILGKTLHTAFGGSAAAFPPVLPGVGQAALERARQWGLGIRLAQRLSAGTAAPLEQSQLAKEEAAIILTLTPEAHELGGEAVDRRLRALGHSLGRGWRMRLTDE